MPANRGPWLAALLLLLGFTALYGLTAAPTVLYADSAELQTVAFTGGVAHPTGYPTYVLLGQVFARVVPGDPAFRITAMSIVFGALAVAMLFLILRRGGLGTAPSILTAILYGSHFYLWSSAIRAEVYNLATFLFLTGVLLTMRALERPTLGRSALAVFVMALTLTAHTAFLAPILFMGIWIALRRPAGGVPRGLQWLLLFAVTVAGLSAYLYLVYADAADYPVNYLDYTIEAGSGQNELTVDAFDHPLERVYHLMTYQGPRHLRYGPTWVAQNLYYGFTSIFLFAFGPFAFLLFLFGLVHAARHRLRVQRLALGIILSAGAFSLVCGSIGLLHVFLMSVRVGVCVFIGFGLAEVMRWASGRRAFSGLSGAAVGVLLFAVVLAVPHGLRVLGVRHDLRPWLHVPTEPAEEAFMPVPNLRSHREARVYGEEIMRVIPENAFVVGKFKEIMVAYYFRYVEGMRPDLVLEPFDPHHLARFERWQAAHDPATHPVVFLGHIQGRVYELAGLDSIRVATGDMVYIAREPRDWSRDFRWAHRSPSGGSE